MEIKEENFQWTNVRNQYIAYIAANLIFLNHGSVLGWNSPAMPQLSSENTPLSSGRLTNEQISWIGSISNIGALCGAFSFGYITSFLGCKRAMIFLAIPSIIFWTLIFFGRTYYHILLARFCGGWTGGGIQSIVILFVSEIANDNIRGRCGGISHVLRNFGILIGYTLGAKLDYQYIPCICVLFPITFAVVFAILPNTPRYYLRKGQPKRAENALRFYKGYKGKNEQEMYKELERLKVIANEQKSDEKMKMSDICNRVAMKGLGISIALSIFSQMTAGYTIINYSVTIFQNSGTTIDPHVSSILLAVALICGPLTATYLADSLGRKRLNFISLMGSAIGQLAVAFYRYLYVNGYDLSAFAWVPVFSLSFVLFISSAGIIPLTVVCSVEYIPSKILFLFL
ncbi:facilitated trehalose transporter Tret1-like isoform X2 [Contarinia nasturtii]|uniref:facilitated trehalose transporter Tret1-like isoform X2 n=1 Tax=Contarinia nasturtii TaxID=265458 RepID=UPI0012D4B20D|nr:facilitated trehalose transporter Tret1-like isoform X2 [Contarinia nasturtii]